MIGFDDIDGASLSDVGVRRSHNQDACAILSASDAEQFEQRGHIFVVADGMGAHAVGELASKLAADTIPHVYGKYAAEGPAAALRKAFVEANTTIHSRGQQNREFEGMGTTGSALLIRPEGAWIGHVGDSRVYRVRGGKIEQMTFDHSLVWEVARRQKKTPEEVQAQGLPTNVIIRSLGPEPTVQVDVEGPYPVRPGDNYLVCSDGLSGLVADREIGAVIRSLPPEEACRFLVHLANLQGGPDNITALVVRVAGEAEEADITEEKAPAKSAARMDLRTWLRLAPWPLVLLFLGILLAGIAILLTYNRWGNELPTFLLAALTLLGGLGGLMLQNYLENHKPPAPAPVRAPRIHRSTDCAATPALLQRMEQAQTTLEERIKEKGWQADWDSCQEHTHLSRAHKNREDLQAAFQEQCRAMLCLMDAFGQHRLREESFKPLWDRAAVS